MTHTHRTCNPLSTGDNPEGSRLPETQGYFLAANIMVTLFH